LKNNKVKFSITKYRRMILEKEKQNKKNKSKKKHPGYIFLLLKSKLIISPCTPNKLIITFKTRENINLP